MTTTSGNTGVPGANPPILVAAAPNEPEAPAAEPEAPAEAPAEPEAPAEEEAAPEAAEEPAPDEGPDLPGDDEVSTEMTAAAAELIPAAGTGTGDIEITVLGNTTGWWVEGKSPRKPDGLRWGPYGMMEALTKCNQLRLKFRLEGRLKA